MSVQTKTIRFDVVTGFLGAGKTTLMTALKKHLDSAGVPASIIVNDIGAKDLVDTEYTRIVAGEVTEIAGGCICYQIDNLVDRLRRLAANGASIIFSDVIGGGVGAYDHVYRGISASYPGQFTLSPFIVVVEPLRIFPFMSQKPSELPDELTYLFDASFAEADCLVLSKIDTIAEEEKNACIAWLKSQAPHSEVFAVSAKEGTGIAQLAEYLTRNTSSLRDFEIGYGGDAFCAAEEKLTWYNRRFFLKSDNAFAFESFENEFLHSLSEKVKEISGELPHLKVFALGGADDAAKTSLTSVFRPAVRDLSMKAAHDSYRVIVNARAIVPSVYLDKAADDALKKAAEHAGAKVQVFFTECFGMMDEGQE